MLGLLQLFVAEERLAPLIDGGVYAFLGAQRMDVCGGILRPDVGPSKDPSRRRQ
jgi:hypothetical protein